MGGQQFHTERRTCERCAQPLAPGAQYCGACGYTAGGKEWAGTDTRRVNTGAAEERPLRTGELVFAELLSWVPLLGPLVFLVWMFRRKGKGNIARVRLAQAKLLTGALLLLAAAAGVSALVLLVHNGVLESLPLPGIDW